VSNPVLLQPRVRKLLQRGIRHHKEGRTQQAEACYRKVLKTDPQCAEALLCRGLVAQEAGQYAESIEWINKALALKPDEPVWMNNLAHSYLRLGENEKARDLYQQVLELRPDNAMAHHGLGTAKELLLEWEEALHCFERAVALDPQSADFLCGLARALRKVKAPGGAAKAYQRALELDPKRHEIYCELGTVLADVGEFGAAVENLRRALLLEPGSAKAVTALGYLFYRQGHLDSALESYRCAVKLDPNLANAHLQLAIALAELGDWAEAMASYERARSAEPESAEVLYDLALAHLRRGQFALGWGEYESRWGAWPPPDGRKLPQPLWKGEPLEGARILLYAEQGQGDTLQFVRYVPLVVARGGKVILEVQRRLHRLLAGTAGASQVISQGDPLPEVTWRCPLLSLPLAFATELSRIPAPIPYVHPDPGLASAWRQRLQRDAVRIGLAWGGNAAHTSDYLRSVPLAKLLPLLRLEGVTFYSLQMGPPTKQLKVLPPGTNLIDLAPEQKDFADTAAIVANLDLVISVDTAVAHLAAAMGKPVWILLAKLADWRWLLEREDSPWYPTVRLFRQSTPRIWQDPVDRIERELQQFVAGLRDARKNRAVER